MFYESLGFIYKASAFCLKVKNSYTPTGITCIGRK